MKNKADRLECCQALKKSERIKKLKQLYDRIKRQIKEKFKYCNLYIKNLPDNYDDDALRELFSPYGKIRSVKSVRKELFQSYLGIKRSVKVFGFVCFEKPEFAKEAKTKLNMTSPFPNLPKLFVDYHQNKFDRNEALKLKQIHQFQKTGGNTQEMYNQNMVIKQMQLGGCNNI